jgi:hypothetical protein
MARRSREIRLPTASAIEDDWQRQATRIAIEKARAVVSGGAVPPMTPIGRLSDTEWGWIVASVLFGWISERATQATANGLETEKTIRNTGIDPNPWDTGAVATILPELANAPIDWTAPLIELSRDEMIAFLGEAYTLIDRAMRARELGGNVITRKSPDGTAEIADAALGPDALVPF